MTRRVHNRPGLAAGQVIVILATTVVVVLGLGAMVLAIWLIHRGRPTRFVYDLTKLRRTDPNLILYEEVGAGSPTGSDYGEVGAGFPTGFDVSRAIAVGADGKVHVAGDRAVRTFDGAGRRLGQIELDGSPGCVADADGGLYVGLQDRVEFHGPGGRGPARWTAPDPKAVFTSLAVTERELFVADARNRVVLRFDKAGKLLGRIGRRDRKRGIAGFVVPSPYFDVAVADDGLLRVTNPGRHRIEAFTVRGDRELAWGRYSSRVEGFSGCCNPVNFALLPDGNFVTCEKGLTRVKLYGPDGRFVGVVAGPESFRRHDELGLQKASEGPFGALDVAVDAAGRVYVLDPRTHEVRTFRRIRGKGPASGPTR